MTIALLATVLLGSTDFRPCRPSMPLKSPALSPTPWRVIVRKGSHANVSRGCLERITRAAVKSGTVRKLNLGCLRRLTAPKFYGSNTVAPVVSLPSSLRCASAASASGSRV